MAKTREQKKQILKDLEDKIGKSNSIVFANFESLGVRDSEKLRNELKDNESEYLVVKKTLLNLALKSNKIDGFDAKIIDGKASVVLGYGDEVMPVKIADKFRTDNEGKINFFGGVLENNVISSEKVGDLAKLPSKEELYARLVGSVNAPISGFVNALAGNLRNFVFTLKAIEEQKK